MKSKLLILDSICILPKFNVFAHLECVFVCYYYWILSHIANLLKLSHSVWKRWSILGLSAKRKSMFATFFHLQHQSEMSSQVQQQAKLLTPAPSPTQNLTLRPFQDLQYWRCETVLLCSRLTQMSCRICSSYKRDGSAAVTHAEPVDGFQNSFSWTSETNHWRHTYTWLTFGVNLIYDGH